LLIVTRDVKEDWFLRVRGQTVGALPGLIREAKDRGVDFMAMPTRSFLINCERYLETAVSSDTLRQLSSGGHEVGVAVRNADIEYERLFAHLSEHALEMIGRAMVGDLRAQSAQLDAARHRRNHYATEFDLQPDEGFYEAMIEAELEANQIADKIATARSALSAIRALEAKRRGQVTLFDIDAEQQD
jgi:hypothetical protein